MDKSSEKVKEIALEACRKHKKLFNEIRERSAKALGFAKMLQKDLGIAAEYNVKVSSRKILELLKSSKHVKVSLLVIYGKMKMLLTLFQQGSCYFSYYYFHSIVAMPLGMPI